MSGVLFYICLCIVDILYYSLDYKFSEGIVYIMHISHSKEMSVYLDFMAFLFND
jgi:hypothetical protein